MTGTYLSRVRTALRPSRTRGEENASISLLPTGPRVNMQVFAAPALRRYFALTDTAWSAG